MKKNLITDPRISSISKAFFKDRIIILNGRSEREEIQGEC